MGMAYVSYQSEQGRNETVPRAADGESAARQLPPEQFGHCRYKTSGTVRQVILIAGQTTMTS